MIDDVGLFLCYLNKLASSQQTFSMCNVKFRRRIKCTIKHGNISVIPNYPGKNWKLGTLKIICKWFDMKGYQSLLITRHTWST